MSAEPETVDGIIADDDTTTHAAALVPAGPRERRSEVIHPLDADELVQSFRDYQAMLPRLLTSDDYQGAGHKRFVTKSGWRKIATAFDLDVTLVSVHVDRDGDGRPVCARAVARAAAPSGRVMDGDGYCSIDEERFQDPRGRQKLEHDLPSTATTRARNRAIADLVGMGAVSAEEAIASASPPPPAEASDALKQTLRGALGKLFNGDADAVDQVRERLAVQFANRVPTAAAQAVVIVIHELVTWETQRDGP